MHKIVGNLPYVQFFYSHFWQEHTHSHHKYLATVDDPVCHDIGTSIFTSVPKAVVGTHFATWSREIARIRHHVKETYGREASTIELLVHNAMALYFILHVSMIFGIYYLFGTGGLFFQLWYTLSGLFWAEAVNYLEHYGLRRRKLTDIKGADGKVDKTAPKGVYEAIDAFHSWNAPASTLAFKIQRHSDHHEHAFRPYQILRHFDDVPTLPYEYILMLWLAACPPMFDYVMLPRIAAVNRAKEGEKPPNGEQEDQWNIKMPMSDADKRRDLVAKVYFGTVTLAFSALTMARGL